MSIENKNNRLLSLEKVGKIFRTPAGDFRALTDVSLEIPAGSFSVLTGASGSGKTSLLHLLAALDTPTQGQILFCGKPIPRTDSQTALWRVKNIGIVFQFFQLLPSLRAAENVMLPMEFDPQAPRTRRGLRNMRNRAMELLAAVGIADYAEKLPQELSGGEQQRVAIARALANDPAVILADEPTGNLDSENAGRVIALLSDLSRRGKTVVLATHDPAIALKAEQRLKLKDGRLL